MNSSLTLKDPRLLRQSCYIDGNWLEGGAESVIPVTNPATGECLGTVLRLGAAETRRAIEAAHTAWPTWRRRTAGERSTILRRWFELMLQH